MIKLQDATLRDGGYINNWIFGENTIKNIISGLSKANIDLIEIGFMKNFEYDVEKSIFSRSKEIINLIPTNHTSLIGAMILNGTYDISLLSEKSESFFDYFRISFHNYDILEGLELAKKIMNLGYDVHINPIALPNYTQKEFELLLKNVNLIKPYAFTIVDTFGSLDTKRLFEILECSDSYLNKDTNISLHLHDNQLLANSLSQVFVENSNKFKRDIIIDATLNGIGRTPGNLQLELISLYLNKHHNTNYSIDILFDLIEKYITPLKDIGDWGYSPIYSLAAIYGINRNYVEYLIIEKNFEMTEALPLLLNIEDSYKTIFQKNYIDNIIKELRGT